MDIFKLSYFDTVDWKGRVEYSLAEDEEQAKELLYSEEGTIKVTELDVTKITKGQPALLEVIWWE